MSIVRRPDNAVHELVEHRTLHSKRFLLDTGEHKIIHHLGRVHFHDDDGSLQDLVTDLDLESGTGDVIAHKLPFKFRLLKKGIGYTYQSRQGGTVRVELRRIGGQQINVSGMYKHTRDKNRVTFSDVATDLDIVIQINRNGLQTFRVLKSPNAATSWRWAITYDTDGLSKIDTNIRGKDAGGRTLAGLSMNNSQPTDNGHGLSTYLCDETWDGTVKTKDPVTRQLSITNDPQYPVYIDPDISDHIAADADDGTEDVFNSFWNNASVFLGRASVSSYTDNSGFRFVNVAVPNGSTITLAQLKVNVTGRSTNYGGGNLYAIASDNAPAWSNSNRPSNLSHTAANVAWPRPSGTGIYTVTCTTVVQEIVNRAGWASGNALSIALIQNEPSINSLTYIEDYSAAGTNEAILEITLAAPPPSVLRLCFLGSNLLGTYIR